MVPLRTIRSDFFDFDEEHYRVVGRRTRRIIRLGDPVKIVVKSTSLDQKLLDYELVEEGINTDAVGEGYDPDREIEYLVDRPYNNYKGSGKKSGGKQRKNKRSR